MCNLYLLKNIYSIAIVFINTFIYLYMFFIFIFVILITNFSKLKYLNQIKLINSYFFLQQSFILIILTLASIPPFIGFGGKFLIIIFLFENSQLLTIFILIILNISMLYFYIQNIRFLINKNSYTLFIYNTYIFNINDKILLNIINLNFINIFSIFIIADIIILYYNIVILIFN